MHKYASELVQERWRVSRWSQMESEAGGRGKGQGRKEERDKKGRRRGCTMTETIIQAAYARVSSEV